MSMAGQSKASCMDLLSVDRKLSWLLRHFHTLGQYCSGRLAKWRGLSFVANADLRTMRPVTA